MHDSSASLSNSDKTLPMSVANISFMLERLGRDCDDLQFIRELTQNALEAEATQIIWDVDLTIYEIQGVYKMFCLDNGHGMSGDELVEYINHLSSSKHRQALDGNYGVGAKVAAATRNPAGLIYQSWKDGKGAMIQLWRDPVTNEYGLRQFERSDGTYGYWQPLSTEAKPREIGEHGTKVTLLGKSEEDNTIEPPTAVPTPSRWVSRYLNARYFRFPDGVEVKAREGWTADQGAKRNLRRTVRGEEAFLDRFSTAKGVVGLSECKVYWWILEESEVRRNASDLVNVGHFAALYQDEIYEMRTARAGASRLQQFGVIFGYDRVVLYVEPFNGVTRRLTANTARTQLLLDGNPLPYADWAAEFRLVLPQEIKDHMDAVIAGSTGTDHRDSIYERLRNYQKLFRLSRYRPKADGRLSLQEVPRQKRNRTPRMVDDSEIGREARPRQEQTGRLLAALLAAQGVPGDEDPDDVPELPGVTWVSLKDGTRPPGILEDRAAKFIPEDFLIQANADFRAFNDMADYWCDQYGLERGHQVVTDVVQEWFEQALVETVIGCQALRGEREWSPTDLVAALSEEALTAAVMPRYHVANSIKRTLGAKLGSLRDRGAEEVPA